MFLIINSQNFMKYHLNSLEELLTIEVIGIRELFGCRVEPREKKNCKILIAN
jgi:hypothetical protein